MVVGIPLLVFFRSTFIMEKALSSFDPGVRTEALAVSSVLLDPFAPGVTVNISERVVTISAGIAKLNCSLVKAGKLR